MTVEELFQQYGVAPETIQVLLSWVAWVMQNAGPSATPFIHAIMDAVRQAREGGPPTSLPAPVATSPLIFAAPPAQPAPVSLQVAGLAPISATFGRTPKGNSPGPLPAQGITPPNVHISSSGQAGGARVQITPGPSAAQYPEPAESYVGQLQPGQQMVMITNPDGSKEPPLLVDRDHRTLTPIPGAAPMATGPLVAPVVVAAAAAPGTLAGAMESVKIAGQLGPKQIAAMKAIKRGEDSPLSSVLIALGLAELKDGEIALSEIGRTALAIAESKAPPAVASPTLAPPAPSEAP